MEHWFVVAVSALMMSAVASLPFTLGVMVWGALSEFWRAWLDKNQMSRFRPVAAWLYSWGATMADLIRRHVGSVPLGELRTWDGRLPAIDGRPIVVLVNGAFAASSGYKWVRWDKVREKFPDASWQCMRFAWAGGNYEAVRQRGAEQLAQRLATLEVKRQHSVRTVLIGHSHGGSVACAAARITRVDDVITIGTPFVALLKKQPSEMLSVLQIGAAVRYLGPMVILLTAYLCSAVFGSLDHGFRSVLVALPFLVAWFLAMYLGDRECKMAQAMNAGSSDARLTIIQAKNDWLVEGGRALETNSMSTLNAIHQATRRARKLEKLSARAIKQPGWREPLKLMGFYMAAAMPWPRGARWFREASAFAILGATLITGFAAGIYPLLSSDVQPSVAPWVFPSTNFLQLKFVLYAFLIAGPYLLLRQVMFRRSLPSWHRATFQRAKYWGLAARLSQIFLLKAHLYGFRSYTLHLMEGTLRGEPPGFANICHVPVHVEPGLGAHSALLSSEECVDAVAEIAGGVSPCSAQL